MTIDPAFTNFNDQFHRDLAAKKRLLTAHVNSRFRNANMDTAKSRNYWLRRYQKEMEIINRVYGRSGSEDCHYLIGFGQNDDGQLGLPVESTSLINQITNFSNCRVVAAGGTSSAVINDGRPYVWGSIHPASDGENPRPMGMMGFADKDEMRIVDVDVGDGHAVFLGMSGDVYSMGFYKDEDSGEFSDTGDCKKRTLLQTPYKVASLPQKASRVFANMSISAAILEDGNLVTWGMSNTGSLARTANMCPKDAKGNYDISPNFYKIVEGDEKGYSMDKIKEHFMTPKLVLWSSPLMRPIVHSVAIGFGHILVTAFDVSRNNGPLLYGAGSNAAGQLGTNDGVDAHHELHPVRGALENVPIADIAAGRDFSLAVTFEGNLFGFGSNDCGQLGLGFTGAKTFPSPQSIRFVAEKPVVVVQVAAGGRFALARTDDGELYTWGENNLEQTGNRQLKHEKKGTELDEYHPTLLDLSQAFKREMQVVGISAGSDHGMIIAKDVV